MHTSNAVNGARPEVPPPLRLLTLSEVLSRVSMSPSRWYQLIREAEAPEPVKSGRSSRWVESEINDWIARRVAVRDGGDA